MKGKRRSRGGDHDGVGSNPFYLLKGKQLGSRVVSIIPDEARTFGLESLFGRYGIYSSSGQLYDSGVVLALFTSVAALAIFVAAGLDDV